MRRKFRVSLQFSQGKDLGKRLVPQLDLSNKEQYVSTGMMVVYLELPYYILRTTFAEFS